MITFEVFESWVQYFVFNSRRKKLEKQVITSRLIRLIRLIKH